MNSFSPERLKELAASSEPEHRLLFKKLKRISSDKVDTMFREAHNEEFDKFDCLSCANCCKSISPMMSHRDVDRMAKGLGIKPSALVEQHLTIDSDGDYVFRNAPCPFLLPDNMCLIYEHRPKACREYPHTDRKRMHQILNITMKNIALCPIVYGVVEKIKKEVQLNSSR